MISTVILMLSLITAEPMDMLLDSDTNIVMPSSIIGLNLRFPSGKMPSENASKLIWQISQKNKLLIQHANRSVMLASILTQDATLLQILQDQSFPGVIFLTQICSMWHGLLKATTGTCLSKVCQFFLNAFLLSN